MNQESNTGRMLYRSNAAVAALNKVPGFDPLKLLRRTVSDKTKEPVLRLDLPYKKLWFRLANPQGRIRLNALRITEQMAIYEAQVYLSQDDAQPAGAFTASCTKENAPDGRYIEAAQREAVNEALSDAGYGLQFADVSMQPEDRQYGSDLPLAAVKALKQAAQADQTARDVQKAQAAQTVQPVQEARTVSGTIAMPQHPAESAKAPTAQASQATERPRQAVQHAAAQPVKQTAPVQLAPATAAAQAPIETTRMETAPSAVSMAKAAGAAPPAGTPVANTIEIKTPVSAPAIVGPAEPSPAYTDESPVEEILQKMSLEQAMGIVVDEGLCKGWTLKEVSEKRPVSLKYYVFNGYKGKSNILRAAARLVLDSLNAKKAG